MVESCLEASAPALVREVRDLDALASMVLSRLPVSMPLCGLEALHSPDLELPTALDSIELPELHRLLPTDFLHSSSAK